MACEKHGYTNGVFCPACDNELIDKCETVETMWKSGKRTDEISEVVKFPVYAIINIIKGMLERAALC